MSQVVWKYELKPNEGDSLLVTLLMPKGAQVLTVQMQGATPQIWALVDPNAPKEVREFQVVGTGHTFEPRACLKYLGTFQLENGAFMSPTFVFHVFEVYS